MLADLQLLNFRCFDSISVELAPDFNFFVGKNGEGKTSLLEAACVLLRLQSQRSSTLAPLIKRGHNSFSVAGHYGDHLLQFGYSGLRRKLAFDHVEQRTASDYLRIARVVSFANTDIELARGGSDARRRYLDFLGAQVEPLYRPALRAYERALRARNALLKLARADRRQVSAYDDPLISYGRQLAQMRTQLVHELAPVAEAAHRAISGANETLTMQFVPGNPGDLAHDLAASHVDELRLRQTQVGPHRDDIALIVDGMPAAQYASEGQQRTLVLALKLAQANVLARTSDTPPLLLIDDIFGELDAARRNALLAQLPYESQKLVTATSLHWREQHWDGPTLQLHDGTVRPVS
jgi:DNA replication and repair protein RecF